MNLKEFKNHFETNKNDNFKYGISEPFSWRGSYDEVAFEILVRPMSKEEILARINLAYTEQFYGYKGGEYRYNDYTDVYFEECYGHYSNGEYCAKFIAKIENSKIYNSQEARFVNIAF